ncbi:hypothetical protein ACEN2T_17395 [Pseudomonas sp. W22_MBD1_FP4]|uniref:hypothetical protein n=1 Tax=Pseudomonas sp. W22_MBD1_FP4 TaxID=3240272 RepID=UPI003F999FF2
MSLKNPAPTLAMWHALYADKAALNNSPDGHQYALDELADRLCTQGLIGAGELLDLIEQARSAYERGVEEQLSKMALECTNG